MKHSLNCGQCKTVTDLWWIVFSGKTTKTMPATAITKDYKVGSKSTFILKVDSKTKKRNKKWKIFVQNISITLAVCKINWFTVCQKTLFPIIAIVKKQKVQ